MMLSSRAKDSDARPPSPLASACLRGHASQSGKLEECVIVPEDDYVEVVWTEGMIMQR